MIEKIQFGFARNFALLELGLKHTILNFKKAQKLKKLRKRKGDTALSFTDFKFLEESKEDMSKSFRLLVTFPFSPEFFFYSYIVFPMMSVDNPWAWKAMPSSFDHPGDKLRRESALTKRRIRAVLTSLQTLQNDVMDDIAPAIRSKKSEHIRIIDCALKQSNLEEAVNNLAPWMTSKKIKQRRNLPQVASLENIPGNIVKECCKAIGVDGVPNIPLINRLNRGEINRYVERVKISDDFLLMKGVGALSDAEIEMVCFERCIPTSNRSRKSMHKDVEQWLKIVTTKMKKSDLVAMAPLPTRGQRGVGGSLVTNYQNKRLALMALNVAKDMKTADHTSIYRTLVCK